MPAPFNLRKFARHMREYFKRTRLSHKQYLLRLAAVARQCGAIVRGFAPDGRITNLPMLVQSLERYAEAIEPWAVAVASRMVEDVSRRDYHAWMQKSEEIGRSLREEIDRTPIGHTMQEMVALQVAEIKSIPLSAADRIYKLANEALTSGRRSADIAREVAASGEVSLTQARMIARTAVATTANTLTEVRARAVGSPGYIWRTSKDSDVRSDHKELEGQFIPWDKPPIVDKRTGYRSHAGCNANCRCYSEPVLPTSI